MLQHVESVNIQNQQSIVNSIWSYSSSIKWMQCCQKKNGLSNFPTSFGWKSVYVVLTLTAIEHSITETNNYTKLFYVYGN